jgi:hypothetical protein
VHEAFIATMTALAPLPPDERDDRLVALLGEVARAARDEGTVPVAPAPAADGNRHALGTEGRR